MTNRVNHSIHYFLPIFEASTHKQRFSYGTNPAMRTLKIIGDISHDGDIRFTMNSAPTDRSTECEQFNVVVGGLIFRFEYGC